MREQTLPPSHASKTKTNTPTPEPSVHPTGGWWTTCVTTCVNYYEPLTVLYPPNSISRYLDTSPIPFTVHSTQYTPRTHTRNRTDALASFETVIRSRFNSCLHASCRCCPTCSRYNFLFPIQNCQSTVYQYRRYRVFPKTKQKVTKSKSKQPKSTVSFCFVWKLKSASSGTTSSEQANTLFVR